ncbi:MAG TPA: hypothetical protein VK876_07490 [Rubrivivax sp.]|nr:hypothetical protein [Rubrivivax sp.]
MIVARYVAYRASDTLYKHRQALQEHLFGQARSMFGLGQTITFPNDWDASRVALGGFELREVRAL